MPELSRFFGIIIAMYYRDHPPPHFHAIYAAFEATVDIVTGAVNGSLPKRAMSLVHEWRLLHQKDAVAGLGTCAGTRTVA